MTISDDAQLDVDAAFDWYEKKQIGLGLRFYLEFRSFTTTLEYAALAFPVKIDGAIRELPLNIFPYVILYEVFDDEVIVYRVFATSKDPLGKTRNP